MSEVAPAVVYPESDGAPLGETAEHIAALMDLVTVLGHRFRDRDDVYVSGNQFLYWVEGNPARSVCPDVYLAIGRPRRPHRRTWRVWDEGPPTLIVELVSASSRDQDLGRKRALYQELGVREYAVFDPLGDQLEPRIRLWRLDRGRYVEVEAGEHGWWSEVAGAWFDVDEGGELVRLRERDGTPVLRAEERLARALAQTEAATDRAEAEAARAEAEAARASRAEAERDRLLAEIARLRRSD